MKIKSDSDTRVAKVLHLYSGNLYGGIETILSTLARHRFESPHVEHEFGLCFEGRLKHQLLATECKVHDLGEVRVSRPWTLWRARRRLRQLLAESLFDVVVTHACWAHALFGRAAQRYCPVVFWGHDINYGKHWLEKWASYNYPQSVIANSNSTLTSIHEHLFSQVPSAVVYCPIEKPAETTFEERVRFRSEMGVDSETPVIVQIGRMEEYKGQLFHLKALQQLPQNKPWQSWIVGGAQRPSEHEFLRTLQKMTEKHGLSDRVRFLGQRNDVHRILAAADLFCQPNVRAEPFGIVFIEALFAGLPVVATSLGGALEIVTPECGRLVTANDTSALACALQELLDNPTKRHDMGVHGIQRAEELCGTSSQMLKLEELFRTVASKHEKEVAHA